MLNPRIIPCLLVHNNGLVKTKGFKDPAYVGDPLNAVKIFNEKSVDELFVLDIDATAKNNEPNYDLISKIAMECQMPLCYGGGISNINQIIKILKMGVEKIAISTLAIKNPKLIKETAKLTGNQSIVVVMDVKKKKFSSNFNIFLNNGKNNTGKSLIDHCRLVEDFGAGEIVINSIDNDGMMNGFDLKLINQVKNSISIPLTVLGGAGSLEDIGKVISENGIIGVAAGSLFVFKGKYKAVLINYPSHNEKENLIFKSLERYETNNTKH